MMEQKKNLSLVNCIATSLLAYFFTVPVHELFHALTSLAYGDKVLIYSATAVQPGNLINYGALSPFHRIMVGGGSASILNAMIGVILAVILLKCTMGPICRVFLIQLMGAQLAQGFGYFLIGGLFAVGDWACVFSCFQESPGFVTTMRIILAVVGSAGMVAEFFLLNHMSYYFIEHPSDKKEKMPVALKLHLLMFILGIVIGLIVSLKSPALASGELSLGLSLFFNLMWIPFFWGFMFTGVMNVLPPKESRFLYPLPAKPNWLLLVVAVILILVDIFIFGPGIYFA